MRRLSVASLDSGAESPVYGEEPSASTERDPAEMPPGPAAGGGRCGPCHLTVPERYLASARAVGPGGITSFHVSQRMAARDTTVDMDSGIPWQVGTGVPQVMTSCDMSVVDPQSGRWYVKDIRASNAADGNPMTWFASAWAVPRGSLSPRKHTDVHGREG